MLKKSKYEKNPRYNVGGIVPNIIDLINIINTTFLENVEKEIGIVLFYMDI